MPIMIFFIGVSPTFIVTTPTLQGKYLYMWLSCSVCRPNVPKNTPIQLITHSARAHQTTTPIALHNGTSGARPETALHTVANKNREAGKLYKLACYVNIDTDTRLL